jgi:hypothetical protein
MPGKRLRRLRMNATVRQVRDERVPQAMEIDHKARVVAQGDARGV